MCVVCVSERKVEHKPWYLKKYKSKVQILERQETCAMCICYCRQRYWPLLWMLLPSYNKRSYTLYAECMNCRDNFVATYHSYLHFEFSKVKRQTTKGFFLDFIVFCYKFLSSTFTYVGIGIGTDISDKPTVDELLHTEKR